MYRVNFEAKSRTPLDKLRSRCFHLRLISQTRVIYTYKNTTNSPRLFNTLQRLLFTVCFLHFIYFLILISFVSSDPTADFTNEIIYLISYFKRGKLTVLLPHLLLIKILIIKFNKLVKDAAQREDNQFSRVLHNHSHSRLASLLIFFDIYRVGLQARTYIFYSIFPASSTFWD